MKIKATVIFIICFVMSSFEYYANNIDRLADNISSKTADVIRKYYGFSLCGSGGSAMDGVEKLTLRFDCPNDLKLDEARRLLVSCVEIFLNNINSDKNLRPLLVEYPFSSTRISFSIGIKNELSDSQRIPGVLMDCSLFRGRVTYITIKEKTSFISVKDEFIMHQETYEEAKRIVDNEKK